jgi:hypothetical protein
MKFYLLFLLYAPSALAQHVLTFGLGSFTPFLTSNQHERPQTGWGANWQLGYGYDQQSTSYFVNGMYLVGPYKPGDMSYSDGYGLAAYGFYAIKGGGLMMQVSYEQSQSNPLAAYSDGELGLTTRNDEYFSYSSWSQYVSSLGFGFYRELHTPIKVHELPKLRLGFYLTYPVLSHYKYQKQDFERQEGSLRARPLIIERGSWHGYQINLTLWTMIPP